MKHTFATLYDIYLHSGLVLGADYSYTTGKWCAFGPDYSLLQRGNEANIPKFIPKNAIVPFQFLNEDAEGDKIPHDLGPGEVHRPFQSQLS